MKLDDLLADLEEVFRGRQTKGYHIRRIAGQAAEKLRRYDELFKWSNENCAACSEGLPIPHPQPLPSPNDPPYSESQEQS